MNPIIRVANLQKVFRVPQREHGIRNQFLHIFTPRYREVLAVDDVNFSLQVGEIVGYLGPNGAGKSTTIKMLSGLLVPTRGEVIVDGWIPWKQRTSYVQKISAVFGQRSSLWWDLPLVDSFELLKPMYHIPDDRYRQNLKLFGNILGLDEFLDTPVRSLSLGQRMRAELGAALLHEPKLLFLDEPTIGLDVVAKERIREFVRYVNRERETTIILTTHDLTDVERLCERVMILDHGHLLYDGSLAALVERFEDHRLLILSLDQIPQDFHVDGLPDPTIEGHQLTFRFDHRKISASEVLVKLNGCFQPSDIEIKRPSIESTIRRIYEDQLL